MVGHLITRLHLLYTAVKFVNQMDKLFPSRSLHPVKWEWPKRQLEHAVKRLAPTTMNAQNTKQWLVCVCECVCVWGRGWSLESETVSQSCLTLCYPMDYSPPGSSVHVVTHLQPDVLDCEAKWALEVLLWIKLVGLIKVQLSYFKS